jgi:hypothetical protein
MVSGEHARTAGTAGYPRDEINPTMRPYPWTSSACRSASSRACELSSGSAGADQRLLMLGSWTASSPARIVRMVTITDTH